MMSGCDALQDSDTGLWLHHSEQSPEVESAAALRVSEWASVVPKAETRDAEGEDASEERGEPEREGTSEGPDREKRERERLGGKGEGAEEYLSVVVFVGGREEHAELPLRDLEPRVQ